VTNARGVVPAENGGPEIAVNPPELALMAKPEMSFDTAFATYTNFPVASQLRENGWLPANTSAT